MRAVRGVAELKTVTDVAMGSDDGDLSPLFRALGRVLRFLGPLLSFSDVLTERDRSALISPLRISGSLLSGAGVLGLDLGFSLCNLRFGDCSDQGFSLRPIPEYSAARTGA